MCGIFGIVGEIADPVRLQAAADVTSHRGPDDNGHFWGSYEDTPVYLDHDRLAIIGLGPQGRQPFQSTDGSIVLTYNGEIYNFETIRDRLIDDYGTAFDTNTDTEVLLEAYRAWGIDRTLDELIGMFAFGLLDLSAGELHVARDHLGVKPVYYVDGDSFMFASEVKALIEKGGVEPRLDRSVLGEYFANFWVYEPDTLFQDVYKLEAGHVITCDLKTGVAEKSRYWDPVEGEASADIESLHSDLERVISDQLVSDVPVGIYLSGGIDSSIVAYHATADEALQALNLLNDTDWNDAEYRNLARLEQELDLDVDSFAPEASMLDIYRQMVYHLDEPIADPAVIPAYLLARKARDGETKVMLSGMGGDEVFAGYRRMRVLANVDRLKPLRSLLSIAHRLWPDRDSRLRRNLGRVSRFLADPSPANYFSLSYYFSKETIASLLDDDAWHDRYAEKIDGMLEGREFVDELQRFQYLDLRGYLASHNLLYMDKASMAASVEVRVPLLDHRIVGKYFNLPTAEKLADGLKTPLKRHLATLLGEEFVGHTKQGFSFPIEDFLEEELREDLESMLEDERFRTAVEPDVARRIVEDHFAGRSDNAMQVWALYTFWLWLESFDVSVE